jgi:3-phosphoshikimate 1-carboxyvinyltransferase
VIIQSQLSKLKGSVLIPASKSHTIRAVAIAAAADGTSVLCNPLPSADAFSSIQAAKALGAEVVENQSENTWTITGRGLRFKNPEKIIDVGNSGTTLRIFTALAALADFPIGFDGDASIRTRLMAPLLESLSNLGVKTASLSGKCPIQVQGPLKGGKTSVSGVTSQFATALLLALPLAENDSEIEVIDLQEKPYVEMTLAWLDRQSILYRQQGLHHFKISGNQQYKPFTTSIPGDFSSAAFPLCAAAVTQSDIEICGLDFADTQGDKLVFSLLEHMGLKIEYRESSVIVKAGQLKGMEIDMNSIPDALPIMAVIGCYATGETHLRNVAHARFKECDRIRAITTELKKMGANIEELPDGVRVRQSRLRGCRVHGYDDHRLVMALAVAGLGASGNTVVDTAEAVGVTYPSFVKDMQQLAANLTINENN